MKKLIVIYLLLFFWDISIAQNHSGNQNHSQNKINDSLVNKVFGKWKITSSVKFSTMATITDGQNHEVLINEKEIFFNKYNIRNKTNKILDKVSFSKIVSQKDKSIEFIDAENIIWDLRVNGTSDNLIQLETIGEFIDDRNVYGQINVHLVIYLERQE